MIAHLSYITKLERKKNCVICVKLSNLFYYVSFDRVGFIKYWAFPNRSIKVLPILGNPFGNSIENHIGNSLQENLFPAPLSPQLHWPFPLAA
jgi:hypothetical protein